MIGCSGGVSTATVLAIVSGGLSPAAPPNIAHIQVSTANGQTVLTWTQSLNASVPADAAILAQTPAVKFYLAPPGITSVSNSDMANMAEGSSVLAPSVMSSQCNNVGFGGSLVASWSILNNNLLAATVTLQHSKAWCVP